MESTRVPSQSKIRALINFGTSIFCMVISKFLSSTYLSRGCLKNDKTCADGSPDPSGFSVVSPLGGTALESRPLEFIHFNAAAAEVKFSGAGV
jgi:hypothetical protein